MVKKLISLSLLFIAAALLVPGICVAQTVYVTDSFQITLRENPGQGERILRMLPSGTELEVLQERENWLRVETPQGSTGWILKRYSMDRIPKDRTIEKLRGRLSTLEEEHRQATDRVAELKEENEALASRLQNTNQTLGKVRQRYQQLRSDVSNLPQIKQNLQQTRQKLEVSQSRVKELSRETEELRTRKAQLWFLFGAGVVFLSALIGFLLGRLQRRKSRTVYF